MSNESFPWTFDVTFQTTTRVTVPTRSLQTQRTENTTMNTSFPWTFDAVFVDTDAVSVFGVGTSSVAIPTRELELTRTQTTVTGLGVVSTTIPARDLSIERFESTIGNPFWTISGGDLVTTPDETATDTALSLVFRVETDTLESVLRPLKDDEGKVDIRRTDDGGFTAIDRADGGNTFGVIPPVNRLPLRQQSEYHVEAYEESLVSQTVDEWDVELELLRTANRTDSPSINETRASDEWAFDTRYGQIATERVDAEFVGRGEGGVRRFEITARLTKEQAHVFEAALNRLGGARIRDIPDATNVAVDDTDDDAATLAVTSPVSDSIVADGNYVVQEWQSRRLNDGFQEAEFVIAET